MVVHPALLLALLIPAAPPDADAAAGDEAVLRATGIPSDGPGLIEFLRRRVLGESDHQRVQQLIRKLGHDDFDVREAATQELRALGPAMRPLLREALRDPDPEVAFRALRCLTSIEQSGRPAPLAAAARTLARLKPPGAAEALLAALPSFEDAEAADEACRALAAVAVRGGRVEPALVQALGDRSAVRRAAAGEALTGAGAADQRPAVARLLQDPDALVRQRVALALFDARDKESIPALIDLLADGSAERSGPAEDALRLAAGDAAPALSPGDDEESRRKCREAWEAWWKEHGGELDLSKVDLTNRRLGYTLVAELENGKGTNGRVVEYDAAGRERWQIGGLRYPIDAQMAASDRVLIAEYAGRVVTERNVKGEVLWEHHTAGLLLGARRLASGDTFVVTRNQLTVVDKDGKEAATIPRANDVCAAAKFRDGTIALLTNAGVVLHLDESGKELKALPLNAPGLAIGTNIEALPNGHVLVPLYSSNKVVEIDGDGKTVWEVNTPQPSSAARLPNGHTLVASRQARAVVELDRDGKEVRSVPVDGRPFRATQR
jgi:hypothetical protein